MPSSFSRYPLAPGHCKRLKMILSVLQSPLKASHLLGAQVKVQWHDQHMLEMPHLPLKLCSPDLRGPSTACCDRLWRVAC